MKRSLGFTRFEFYFVVSIVGILVLLATQRYRHLADETKRLSFDVIAKHFSAAVYNHHARWILTQPKTNTRQINIDGLNILFSGDGWPIAILAGEHATSEVSTLTCLSLWNHLLQNPPSISVEGNGLYGSHTYHLSSPQVGNCRFELATEPRGTFYFDYVPLLGRIVFNTQAITKNN